MFPTLEDLRYHLVRLFPSIPGGGMYNMYDMSLLRLRRASDHAADIQGPDQAEGDGADATDVSMSSPSPDEAHGDAGAGAGAGASAGSSVGVGAPAGVAGRSGQDNLVPNVEMGGAEGTRLADAGPDTGATVASGVAARVDSRPRSERE